MSSCFCDGCRVTYRGDDDEAPETEGEDPDEPGEYMTELAGWGEAAGVGSGKACGVRTGHSATLRHDPGGGHGDIGPTARKPATRAPMLNVDQSFLNASKQPERAAEVSRCVANSTTGHSC